MLGIDGRILAIMERQDHRGNKRVGRGRFGIF
jgi:hypothetical protein